MTPPKKDAVTKAVAKYKKVKAKAKLGSGKRFAAVEAVAKASGAKNPGAVAASIGIKKYGKAGMAKMAAAGKKK